MAGGGRGDDPGAEPFQDFRRGRGTGRQHHVTATLHVVESGQMSVPAPLRVRFGQDLQHHLHRLLDAVPRLLAAQRPLAAHRRAALLPHPELHDQRHTDGPLGHGRPAGLQSRSQQRQDRVGDGRCIDPHGLDVAPVELLSHPHHFGAGGNQSAAQHHGLPRQPSPSRIPRR